MPHPGQYPNRWSDDDKLIGRKPDPSDAVDVPCTDCGSIWREVVRADTQVRHRLDPEMKDLSRIGLRTVSWYFCLGCGEQLNVKGEVVADAPPEIHKLRRAR